MTGQETQSDSDAPGGLLVLAENGTIVRSPPFFRRILSFDSRVSAPSIFHLFDPANPPYLKLDRIFRHSYGATEYHLQVQSQFGVRHRFRYWPIDETERQTLGSASFYIVDDSALLQTHDWDFRRLRREILSDVQESLSSYFKNRLATLQLLTETLRDAPELASESAPRMVRAVDELKVALNRVITGVDDIESPAEYQDSPVRITDLSTVIDTWGTAEIPVRCSIRDVSPSTLVSAALIERILLPIVENALDASPAGSAVDVIIAEVDEGFVHIEVVDEGEGMSERLQRRAQDPFFSTRTGQLGLGLAHAREALSDAGGEWKFESDDGDGSRVILLLPTTTAAQLFR